MTQPAIDDLFWAIQEDRQALVRALVPVVGVDCRDPAGRTPLMLAEYFRRQALVDYLEAAGADIRLRDHDGRDRVEYRVLGEKQMLVEGLAGVNTSALLAKVNEERLASMTDEEKQRNEKLSDRRRGL